jgi:tetratricopeptide (TPR) repeat protein
VPKLLRLFALISITLTLVNCSFDPQVVKKKYLDSGNKYFDKGRYKEAQIMYKRALSKDPKYGEAYYKLAMTSLKLNQAANSVPALRRAAELLPKGSKESNEANLNLAEILLAAAQTTDQETRSKPLMDDVHQITDEFLKRDPKSYEGHKLTADILLTDAVRLYRKGDVVKSKTTLEQAIAEYRTTVGARPDDSTSSLSLARALALYGELGEAEQLFRASIDKNPTNEGPYLELYRIYISEKKVSDAEALLKKAIAANPKEPRFPSMLAAHYFSNGNRPEGVKILDKMKQDLKSFPSAYFTAGDFYLRAHDTENAMKQFQEGEEKDKAHKAEYQKRIIGVLVNQGKTAQAYETNLEILKDNPKDPEARGLKATFLLDKGDVNQAINELQAVVTARPDNFVARFQLGRAHYAKQEYEQARQQFEKASQLRKDYLPPRLAMAQVALARGEYDSALKIAQDTLKIDPSNGPARLLLSAALMRQGNFKESREILTDVLAKYPKQPQTLLELGILNLSEKKYEDSAAAFRQAYEADPTNLKGLMGQAEAYIQMHKPDEAINVIQAEVTRFPARNDLRRNLADTQFRTGHIDQAIAAYKELMPMYKDSPRLQGELYARIADGYILKKDNTAAIAELRKAHALEPESTPIINGLALLLENGGNHAEARKLYQESISRKQDDPEALNNLAYLMAETGGNLDEALTLATRAKQKLPNYPEISDTIGWIYLKKNLADSAVDIFKDLTAKAPGNSTYHYHYAMAFMQKGDRAGAKKQCEEALKAKPKDAEEEKQIRELMAKTGD